MQEITIEDGIEMPEEEREDFYSDDDLFEISSWEQISVSGS